MPPCPPGSTAASRPARSPNGPGTASKSSCASTLPAGRRRSHRPAAHRPCSRAVTTDSLTHIAGPVRQQVSAWSDDQSRPDSGEKGRGHSQIIRPDQPRGPGSRGSSAISTFCPGRGLSWKTPVQTIARLTRPSFVPKSTVTLSSWVRVASRAVRPFGDALPFVDSVVVDRSVAENGRCHDLQDCGRHDHARAGDRAR